MGRRRDFLCYGRRLDCMIDKQADSLSVLALHFFSGRGVKVIAICIGG